MRPSPLGLENQEMPAAGELLHEASMRALRAAAYVKKRRNCSLAGGGDVSTHGRGSPAVAEGQDDSVPSPR